MGVRGGCTIGVLSPGQCKYPLTTPITLEIMRFAKVKDSKGIASLFIKKYFERNRIGEHQTLIVEHFTEQLKIVAYVIPTMGRNRKA